MPKTPPLMRPIDFSDYGGYSESGPNHGDVGHKIDLSQTPSAHVAVTDPARGPTSGGGEMISPVELGFGTGIIGDVAPVTLTIESSRYKKASVIKAKIPPQGRAYPSTGVDLQAFINGKLAGAGRLEEAKPSAMFDDFSATASNEDAGLVPDTEKTKAKTITLRAYDEIRYMKQKSITKSYKNRRISKIVKDVFQAAEVSGEVDMKNDPRITVSYDEAPCEIVLDSLAHRIRGIWLVGIQATGGNTILFTDDPPIQHHFIGGILQADAGLMVKPWDGVVVYGGKKKGEGKGSTEVKTSRYMFSNSPIMAKAGQTGKNKRVYEYTDPSIHTVEAAAKMAHSLYDELQRQTSSGMIKIVGNAAIQPMDTVTMPPSMGNSVYAVSQMKHKISVDEGFTTELHVSDLVSEKGREDAPGTAVCSIGEYKKETKDKRNAG